MVPVIWRVQPFLGLTFLIVVSGQNFNYNYNDYAFLDQEMAGGALSGITRDAPSLEGIQVAQPLTYGAAFQNELQRLQTLQEVFPPKDLSYFEPYGDRTTLALQFPDVKDSDLAGNDWSVSGYPGSSSSLRQEYGAPFHQKGRKLRKPKHFGVVMSENHIYRENVRAQGDYAKTFMNARSSQDALLEVGKALAASNAEKVKEENNKKAHSRLGGGWGPEKPKETKAFALVLIESRSKVIGDGGRELSLTNGSLVFPSPSDPEKLTFVPFILRKKGDIRNVFQGYYEHKMEGLVPEDKRDLLSFLDLIEGVHEDSHAEGTDRISRTRRLSGTLTRPRLPVNNLLADDPLETREDEARNTLWLQTSTLAIRTLKFKPPHKKGWSAPPPSEAYGPPSGAYGPPLGEYGPPPLQPVYPPVEESGPPIEAYPPLEETGPPMEDIVPPGPAQPAPPPAPIPVLPQPVLSLNNINIRQLFSNLVATASGAFRGSGSTRDSGSGALRGSGTPSAAVSGATRESGEPTSYGVPPEHTKDSYFYKTIL